MRPDVRDHLGPPITVQAHRSPPAPAPARPVTHQQSVLSYCVAGTAWLEMHGRWRVSAGDVFVIPAGEPHRLTRETTTELVSVGICVPCVASTMPPDYLVTLEQVRAGGAAVMAIPPARRRWLRSVLAELQDVVNSGAAAGIGAALALVTLLMHEIRQASALLVEQRSPEGLAHQVLRCIESRCLGPLTLADVAAAVHRSPAYVTTAMSQQTGRSVGEWVVAFRLAEARRLLLYGDHSVERIAERIGYHDPSHFIRRFRREHGMTPAAWRTRAREHHHGPRPRVSERKADAPRRSTGG